MKNLRLILIPEDTRSPRQINIGSRTIRVALIMLAAFFIVNFALLGWNILHLTDSIELSRLHREQQRMQTRLIDLQNNADSLSLQLDVLSEKNRVLYASTGIDQPEHGYAVGGRQLKNLDKKSFDTRIAYEIDSLRFIARQEVNALTISEKKFDEREKILRHTPSIKPMKGFYSSPFGKRLDPITGTWRMHEGVDICAPKGTPVHATADGRVKAAKWEHGFGKVVIIDHIWYETRYAHLDEFLVKAGQKVKRGDVVGKCGRTGRVTGVHLHYEVRVAGKPVNPMDYILPKNICVD